MQHHTDIPATLNRLYNLISAMGYECEVIDKDELFVFTATTHTYKGDEITLNINVTENGPNDHIGQGNYIAFEVFIPCQPEDREEEMEICYYIMKLIMEVDMTTIQYVPQTQQILISRVDCISEDLTDNHITQHIIKPVINEFLHIFDLIESTPLNESPTPQYLN